MSLMETVLPKSDPGDWRRVFSRESVFFSFGERSHVRCVTDDLFMPQLPRGLCESQSVLDVMASQTGRRWWLAHGVELDVAFDVRSGSRSRRTVSRYLRSRKKRFLTPGTLF